MLLLKTRQPTFAGRLLRRGALSAGLTCLIALSDWPSMLPLASAFGCASLVLLAVHSAAACSAMTQVRAAGCQQPCSAMPQGKRAHPPSACMACLPSCPAATCLAPTSAQAQVPGRRLLAALRPGSDASAAPAAAVPGEVEPYHAWQVHCSGPRSHVLHLVRTRPSLLPLGAFRPLSNNQFFPAPAAVEATAGAAAGLPARLGLTTTLTYCPTCPVACKMCNKPAGDCIVPAQPRCSQGATLPTQPVLLLTGTTAAWSCCQRQQSHQRLTCFTGPVCCVACSTGIRKPGAGPLHQPAQATVSDKRCSGFCTAAAPSDVLPHVEWGPVATRTHH